MKVLLDTHTFLWWVDDSPRLSNSVKEVIANPENTIFFSVVSAWEIVIKQGIGKLALPEPAEMYIPSRLKSNRFSVLTINLSHILQIASLPSLHKDPFDRLLIAQSQIESFPILSVDQLVSQYPVSVIW